MEIDTSALRRRNSRAYSDSGSDIGASSSRSGSGLDDDDLDDSVGTGAASESNPNNVNNLSTQNFGTIAARVPKRVSRLRQTVIVLFIYMAVFLPIIIYIITRNREVETFESDYRALSTSVIENVAQKLSRMINALDYVGVAATSHALRSNASWPFVTMDDFDLRGAAGLEYTDILTLHFRPLVTSDNRDAWDEYTRDNSGWYSKATQRHKRSITMFDADGNYPGVEFVDGIAQHIYQLNSTANPAPVDTELYFPGWQVMPLTSDLVNMNIFPYDYAPVLQMIESSEAVLGVLREIQAGAQNVITTFYDFVLQHYYDNSGIKYGGEPVSTLYYPAFDTFGKDRKVVGLINAAIFWNALFQDILPENANGIVCVVENECGGIFTFGIDGKGASYLGSGDLHEEEYDEFAVTANIVDAIDSGDFPFSGTAVPVDRDYCPYTLTVYPSDQLHQEHYSNEPPFYALGVVLLFVVVFFVSMTYDCVVQRRMRTIVKTADENKALVASIFPAGVRDRLFQADTQAPTFAMGASNKARLKAMLGGKDSKTEKQDLSFLTAKPVADLFPHCTVLFSDISGFSAWSSERQPEQVFTLLETIFQTFDKIARKRHVFKVETIGDSYVAVTGLPDAQPDHAVRMARFAKDCLSKVNSLTKMLEATLGPDTGELKMRFGLHSGQVTAGVLRGEKSRFQLFGDTVNTAARMESTGIKNRIQLSHTTAQLLIESGKEGWIIPREDTVKAKGKGVVQTYWMIHRESRGDEGSVVSKKSFITDTSGGSSGNLDDMEDLFAADPKEGVWGDQALFTVPPSSRAAKSQRLVNWLTEIIALDLKRLAAHRNVSKKVKTEIIEHPEDLIERAEMPLEEVVEAFSMPGFNSKFILRPEDIDAIVLPELVREQLHDFVSTVSIWYRTNPFHNFEHASHVTMSSVKLLKRIVTPDGIDYAQDDVERVAADMHTHTFGITSDPLAQFATTLAALIHDVDHMGVPNFQVAKEVPGLGEKYKQQSIAEQNSIDIAWRLLMEPKYKALQAFIFQNERELKRFRQYLVNLVCATDIFNKDMKAIRNQRWDKAFSSVDYSGAQSMSSGSNSDSMADKTIALKATIVLEHIIQAADVSHTMQHWNVYKKWNERLFQEMLSAYDNGRANTDPSEGWYKGELWFYDNYIIPLAQKLEECGVFGVSSDECLNYALENRKEWALKGKDIVKEMSDRYHKRKMLDMDGFTNDEIENFSSDDLDYILHRLVKKGRTFATFRGAEENGLENAAKAWFNAFDLYSRSHMSGKQSEQSYVFPIYSGLFVFLKGGMVLQDPDCSFEKKMSEAFSRETTGANNNVIHRLRALSMKCEVEARHKNFDAALQTFETLDKTYIIEEHSQRVLQYYGTDRAAQIYSHRALWHHMMGNKQEESKCCDYVVAKILPWMETKNVLNTFELLYPVIRLQKENGRAGIVHDVFEVFVMKEYNFQIRKQNLCRPVLNPLSMLLRVVSDPQRSLDSLEDVLDYLNSDESRPIKAFLDRLYSKIGWAPNSIIAELCMVVAKRVMASAGADGTLPTKLVRKGLYLARLVKMRLAGEIGVECAVEINEKVVDELTAMAESLGCLSDTETPHEPPVAEAEAPLKTHLGEIRLAV